MPTLPQRNYQPKGGESHIKDRCGTPAWALPPLLPYLNRRWTIWESAAGEGLLVDALHLHGFENVIATELLTGTDYFAYEPESYDCQITNVPFSIKHRWMLRACQLGKPFALLAPSAFIFTKGGSRLIRKYGIEVLMPEDGVRVDYKMPNQGWSGAGSQFHSSWFSRGLSVGAMFTYVYMDKPPRRKRLLEQVAGNCESVHFPVTETVQLELF